MCRPLSTSFALAAVLTLSAASASADVEFYATAEPSTVSLGDTVTWQIVLSGAQHEAPIELPSMDDWAVVNKRQGSSTQITLGGGGFQTTQQTTLTVVLSPARTGSLTILPAHVKIDGKDYPTASLSVKVLPAGSTPPPNNRRQQQPDPNDPFAQLLGGNPFAGLQQMQGGQNPFGGIFGEGPAPKDSDLFIRASLDKKQVYLGEQVTLSLYIFTRFDISEVTPPKMPKVDAFWAEEIEAPSEPHGEVKEVNGVPYRVFLLRRRALFPLRSGKLTIEPTEVDVVASSNPFGGGRKSHRVSQPLELEVLPLPAGAPLGFDSTNVGNWKMSLSTNPPSNGSVQTLLGTPVTVDLTIDGTGSFKNLALPKMPVVRGLHIFDPTTADKAAVRNGRFGGKRTLEFIVSPEQTGSFEIPPITLNYFNPDTKSYEAAKTAPLHIDVAAGAGGSVAAPGPNAVSQPNQVSVLSSAGQLKPIHTLTDSHKLTFVGEPLHRRSFFIPLLAAPFALYVLLLGAGVMRARAGVEDPSKRIRGAQSRARRRFKGAEALLESGESAAYYGMVAKTLNDYLSDKLGVSAAGLTRRDLSATLTTAGASAPSVTQVIAVLEACDLGRFAPGAQDARRKVLDDGAAAVEALESQKLKRAPAEQVSA